MRITVPEQLAVNARVLNSPARQLRHGQRTIDGTASIWSRRGINGVDIVESTGRRTLLVAQAITPPGDVDEVLVVDRAALEEAAGGNEVVDARTGHWLFPRKDDFGDDTNQWIDRREEVTESWGGQFFYKTEKREAGLVVEVGLRTPQIGALHAILAHWTVTTDAATIVMPTGTGKTETMVAMLVAARPAHLLVVVPTDALRDQIATKFMTLGILRECGAVGAGARFPIVCSLKRRPRTDQEVAILFDRCNVIVTTMSVAGGCSEAIQEAMATRSSHLVIDEAHHVSAATWTRFRRFFSSRPVLQFTATPFRNDRKHVDGKVVYNYPLRKAQEEGIFKRINFRPITEYDREEADKEIARVACDQLSKDLVAGFDHVIMARAGSIARASEILTVYQEQDDTRATTGIARIGAVLVHSGVPASERTVALDKLRRRDARIVVCVDMFGEGFDMPELKVAALHDMHKSLAITLQFTGRFTRTQTALGDATMVANVASADVEESLRELYAEDADWNLVLRELYEGATGRHAQRGEFLARFTSPPAMIPLQNVSPKMSTVVYRTQCDQWRPDRIPAAVGDDRLHGDVSVNHQDRVAMFVTREVEALSWGDIREISNIIWDVYVVHWDAARHLLYVHSSNNRNLHAWLAEAVAGEDVSVINGEPMFRGFHGLHRLMLMNLGLKQTMNRNVQFIMYAGSDVLAALPDAQQVNRIKSNMFGRGYEEGKSSSYGCSYKGRAWAYKRAADIGDWVEWCHSVGGKLIDEGITTEAALKWALIPERAEARPSGVPLSVRWPDDLIVRSEEVVEFRVGGITRSLYDTSIEIVDPQPTGPIRFRLVLDQAAAEYEIIFGPSGVEYRPTGTLGVELVIGTRSESLSDFFRENPPEVNFSNGSFLFGDWLFRLRVDFRPPFDRENIEVWDWTGVDIRKESQGLTKVGDSVQRRVIEILTGAGGAPPAEVVFDDDNPGEAADVVTLRTGGGRLLVQLVHCKFSGEAQPGARVTDLYTVCGQAQTSVSWRSRAEKLLEHMEGRDRRRTKAGGVTRFERGDLSVLRAIRRSMDQLDVSVEVTIVQPGLSRARASTDQLELLAVTQHYLKDTFGVPLRVIGSA